MKTIFCDIDGTLVKHKGFIVKQYTEDLELLDGTVEKLAEWDRKGYNIILTTGRREGMRRVTEDQLCKLGIFYDQLIMGIGPGTRVVINDKKPNSADCTAEAICIERNKGIGDINI
jgi:phosphoglycolate phosphatase-like HAD superfamily hydrolase